MALETETVTAQEYIQGEMDERDRLYMEMFRSEQRADELIGQRLDQMQRDFDKAIDNVAQRFSDKLAESDQKIEATNRLFWLIVGGATVLATLARFLNVRL